MAAYSPSRQKKLALDEKRLHPPEKPTSPPVKPPGQTGAPAQTPPKPSPTDAEIPVEKNEPKQSNPFLSMFTTFKDPNKIDENSPLYQSMAAEKQNKTDQWQSILNGEFGGFSKDFGMPKSFEAAGKPKEKSSGSSASPLATLGNALGTPVRTTPGVVGSGMYFNGQNIITPNTATPVADVLANDLSRSQQANPTDYNAFADMLLSSDFYMQELASRGFTPETFTQSVLDAFRQKDGLGIPREQGEYEAANLFAKEFLFSDAEAVARLKSTDPALFEKVSGWAQSLEKRLRGTDFAAAGSAIARLYSVAPVSGQGYNEEEQKQLARAFETADRIISLTPAALSGSGEGRPPVYDFTKTPEENKALREKYDDWWKNATPFERLNQIKSGVEWTDRKPLPYARIDPLSDFGREAMQKQQAEWEAGPFAGLSDLEAAIKLLEMDESEFFQLPESVQETALINYILQVKQSENYWTNFSANFSDSEKVNAFANAFVNEYILGGAVDKLMRLFNGGPTDRQLQADFLALRYPYQTGAGKVAAWFVPGLNTAAAGKLEALFTPLAGKVSDKMMRKLSGLWNMSPEALAQSKWRSALLKGGEKALTRGLASGAADLTLGTAQSLISGSSLSDALRDGIRSGQWGLYGGVAAGAVAGAIEGFRLSELAQAYHKAGGDFMWGDVTNWFRIGPYYDEYLMRGGDAAYGSFDAYLMFERLDDLYGELGGNQVWGSKDDFAEKVFVEADWLRYSSADAPTVLKYVPTSGVSLKSTPGKTTTILGRFNTDTYSIIQELHLSKSLDFSGNLGGFNLLNVPDGCYLSAEQFWNEFNKPFLDAAIRRGDVILMATPISLDNLYLPGTTDLTGYGREYFYLLENGYTYLDGKMILE